MGNENYVTQQECEDRRSEFREELNGQNLRLTIIETNMRTISVLSKLILGAVLSTSGVIFARFFCDFCNDYLAKRRAGVRLE